MGKADLQVFINTHYKAPRIVMTAAGGVKLGDLVKLAEYSLGMVGNTSVRKCASAMILYRWRSLPLASRVVTGSTRTMLLRQLVAGRS